MAAGWCNSLGQKLVARGRERGREGKREREREGLESWFFSTGMMMMG